MRLQGKSTVVTGVSQPVGGAIARAYAREGASVVCVDADERAAKEFAASVVACPGMEAVPYRADPSVPEEAEALVGFVGERFGRLDVLLNHPTPSAHGRVTDLDVEEWETGIRLGLTSAWCATRASLRLMLAQGSGAIVNSASLSGLAAAYGTVADNVVHAGLVNLTRATAIDYARVGIRCNAVCYGPVVDPEGTAPSAAVEAVPMGRFGVPHELAEAAVFLASDEASFITGACFVVDGGLGAHTNFAALGSAVW